MQNKSETDNIKYEIVDQDLDSSLYGNSTPPSVEPLRPTLSTNTNTQSNLGNDIAEYIKLHNPKLYILTPCFASLCYVNYVSSLMATIELFKKCNFPLQIEFCKNDSLVSRARNNLVARALTDPDATHILFIDNDITWNPVDVMKLVLADKPLAGGIYPLKHYDWSKLTKDKLNPYNSNVVQSWVERKNNSQLKNMMTDESAVQHKLLEYNINYLDGNYLSIENNLAKVRHLATGFMMIQRSVFTTMMKAFPSTKYVDDVNFLKPHENANAYALFDCGVEDGHYYSEDWLFCSRWLKLGEDIWIDVTINLTHTGIEDYTGSYISSII